MTTKLMFWYIILISVAFCFWACVALGQPFPEKPTARLGKGTIFDITYSPDGKLLAVAGSIGVWLYDAGNLNEVGLLEGYTRLVRSVAFSPDGKTLASGSDDKTVRLWDVAEQKQVAVLEGHTGGVNSVAFSRGGRWLASGSIDGTILLWEVNLPSPLGVKPGGKQPIILGGLKRTMLLQNFPNPFNPETWIPFKLAEEAPVTIRIYDAQGQLVRKLKLGQNPPGAYFNRETAAYWNGKNNCDESVASGVYLYQLRAGNFAMTKKMLLVK